MTVKKTPHTPWCARGHYCALGEHRSEPIRWQTPYGGIVAALVHNATTGRAYLELRASIAIPTGELAARRQAAAIATGVHHVIHRAVRRSCTVRQITG